MLLRRRRPPLFPLAFPRYWAQSDGQDQPPLAATSPLHAHLASPRAHARILHTPPPPYSARVSPHDSPVFAPLCPHPAIPRSLPPHVAKSSRALPGPRPAFSASRRPPAAPLPSLPSAGDGLPLSPYISPTAYQSPPLSFTRQPLTCAPSAGSYTARVLLLTRRLTLAASQRCLRARARPATAFAFAWRPRSTTVLAEGEATAEPAQQEGCVE